MAASLRAANDIVCGGREQSDKIKGEIVTTSAQDSSHAKTDQNNDDHSTGLAWLPGAAGLG